MIELTGLGVRFGTTEIFAEIDLKIPEGGLFFLTGPSGAGKTTFLRLCYLDLLPTMGRMKVFDTNVKDLARDDIADLRRRIGVVHQDCQFLDHLSVAENVALPLIVAGQSATAKTEELGDLLKWVGLEDRRDARPPELSGGERQRAALARAVIRSPDVIIADEPTGNVDWDMGQRVMTLLVQLNKMGKTILVATHDLNLIRAAARQAPARVLRLAGKRLVKAGAEV